MPEQTVPRRVVVSLPDAPLDDHVGVVEVLIQEGLTQLALPAACEAFADVVAIFGARAVVGATRVADADGVRLDQGPVWPLVANCAAAIHRADPRCQPQQGEGRDGRHDDDGEAGCGGTGAGLRRGLGSAHRRLIEARLSRRDWRRVFGRGYQTG